METTNSLPQAPPGWVVMEEKGRFVYLTSHPVVKIQSAAMLAEYHQKGRYLTISSEDLIFSRKKFKSDHQLSSSIGSSRATPLETDFRDSLDTFEPMQIEEMKPSSYIPTCSSIKDKLGKEKEKVLGAVESLTIDPNKNVDHKEVLMNTARKLNIARLSTLSQVENVDLSDLKSEVCKARDENEMAKILWSIPFFQKKFSTLINSKYLEQLLNLGSASDSPLHKFPPNINSNLYSEIIELALNHAPDFLLLIMNLTIKHESPLTEKDVIRTAFLFAQFASSVNSKNNVLRKIKSISLKCSGLTNEGLDCLATVGAAETSRTFRNDRDFMASISDEILKSYAKTMIAQFTFDNLDIQINHTMHHLTLNYLEFEQTNTSEFSAKASKNFEEMKSLFSMETVLMQSNQNKDLFDQYKNVVAATLGRIFGKEIPAAKWMLSVFPKHYLHPNSSTASRKSLIHVDKPMYLQETKNR